MPNALGLGLGLNFGGGVPFSPAMLFASGEQGVWYDPSDLSTMFQDSAGTTAVTGYEQPVGKINDKSGKNNHATQSTAASRPVLSARYNMFTQAETLSDTGAWPGSFSTNGTRSGGALTITGSEGFIYFAQNLTLAAISYKLTADVVCGQTIANVPFRVSFGAGGWSTKLNMVAGVTQRLSITFTPTAGTGGLSIGLDARDAIVAGGSNATGYTVTFNKLDLRVADEATYLPGYQRVGAATAGSSIASGTADYNTAGFPPYLSFDGIDDSLATSSIDFSVTDKVTVLAGVRKLSDAAIGLVTELSASVLANTNAFYLAAPLNTGATANFSFYSRGSGSPGLAGRSGTLLAPNTAVLLGTADIAGDLMTLRTNAVAGTDGTGDQGTGNFGNFPLYVGSRGGSSLYFNGRLYGLVVRGAATTSAQILTAESWMNQKTRAY